MAFLAVTASWQHPVALPASSSPATAPTKKPSIHAPLGGRKVFSYGFETAACPPRKLQILRSASSLPHSAARACPLQKPESSAVPPSTSRSVRPNGSKTFAGPRACPPQSAKSSAPPRACLPLKLQTSAVARACRPQKPRIAAVPPSTSGLSGRKVLYPRLPVASLLLVCCFGVTSLSNYAVRTATLQLSYASLGFVLTSATTTQWCRIVGIYVYDGGCLC